MQLGDSYYGCHNLHNLTITISTSNPFSMESGFFCAEEDKLRQCMLHTKNRPSDWTTSERTAMSSDQGSLISFQISKDSAPTHRTSMAQKLAPMQSWVHHICVCVLSIPDQQTLVDWLGSQPKTLIRCWHRATILREWCNRLFTEFIHEVSPVNLMSPFYAIHRGTCMFC